MESQSSQYLNKKIGDDGNIAQETITPHPNSNYTPNFNNVESEINTPQMGKNAFKAETEVNADIEDAPLVKHGADATSPISPNRAASKPVTLSFKDLSYSVQIKNKGQKDGPKCKF